MSPIAAAAIFGQVVIRVEDPYGEGESARARSEILLTRHAVVTDDERSITPATPYCAGNANPPIMCHQPR